MAPMKRRPNWQAEKSKTRLAKPLPEGWAAEMRRIHHVPATTVGKMTGNEGICPWCDSEFWFRGGELIDGTRICERCADKATG